MIFERPPWHPGKNLAGTELEWLPTDTKENFDKLMQDSKHRQYFHDKGWDQPGAITYRINSQGFRSEEFASGDWLLALGCSYTMGIGLPVQDLWPSLLGKSLGLQVANIAWPGSSADTCFRLAEYWIKRLKPKAVCMLVPPWHRIELLMDPAASIPAEVFMPHSLSKYYKDTDVFLTNWFMNEENQRLQAKRNRLAITQLAQEHNVWCCIVDSNDYMTQSREEIEYARDYMHGGPRAHKIIAEKILNDWHERHT